MLQKPELTLRTADVNGYVPNMDLIGVRLEHTGNCKVYVITGFAWLGDTGTWGFTHLSPGGVICCRPMSHLLGKRDNGVPRYIMIG